MTVLEEVGQLLAELGLGTYEAGGTIYLVTLPSEPDECMAVTRYGGREADAALGYDEIGLQVRVRGSADDVTTGEAKAQAVYDHLHGLRMRYLTPGGTWLQMAIGTQAGPVYIGRDGGGRPEWTVNFRCELQRPTANRV